jgi:protocatechuate 3,4-dioxygenase alpha subunit
VFDGDGVPVPDAMIEIWQADADGKYHHPDDPQYASADPECRGFGRMGTGDDGTCLFETIKPGRVPTPDGVLQSPHLNLALFARGLLKQLYTRVYFANDPASNDPANEGDPILASVPRERRNTLIAQLEDNGRWKFEIKLQGRGETVFFDV